MFLYVGGGRSANSREIIGLFDMDTATVGQPTRAFLASAQKRGQVRDALDPGDIPRSFVLTADGTVFLTQTSAAQLAYRAKNPVRKR